MRRRKFFNLFLLTAVTVVLCCLMLAACNGEYGGGHTVPDLKQNEVLHIERNRLSFAKDMEIDSADVIARCNVMFRGDGGEELYATAEQLESGIIEYEEFDLSETGSNKQVKITYKGTANYIFYDVNEYTVNFYTDEEQTNLWTSAPASASLSEDLGLAVWVNINSFNYSTDADVREYDEDGAARFEGWYDSSRNSVTGLYSLSAPTAGNERVLNLHAHYMEEEEFALLDLSYDESGRRVFSGWRGAETDRVRIPEGVTYVDFSKVFKQEISFSSLHIPSTARIATPFMSPIDSDKLAYITVDKGSLSYSSYGGALYSKDFSTLYYMPSSAKNVEFHSACTEFASYSCAYWQETEVTIPESVGTLGHYCFAYSELREVNGLGNVKTIMSGVFYNSNVVSYRDGDVALYNVISNDDGRKAYVLSMILDRSIEEYSVIDGTVSIAGDAFKGCTDLKNATLPNGLTLIGASAFSGCTSLESISFPSTVSYLGETIFYGCTSLERVENLPNVTFVESSDGREFPNTLPTGIFRGCSSLSDVTLPDGLTQIASQAFYDCKKLVDIALPSSVEIIGSSAFRACGIERIELPQGLRSLGSSALAYSNIAEIDFSKCVSLKELPIRCFDNCKKLTAITIPKQFEKIPEYCFYQTTNLKTVTFENVKILDTYAFNYSGIATIIWSNVERIESRAFANCTSLIELEIPDSVEFIGGYAFQSSTKLQYLTLGSGLRTFGEYHWAEDGISFENGAQPVLYACSGLKAIYVSPENTYFTSVDGVLYGRGIDGKEFGDCSVLYAVPRGYPNESLTLLDSTIVMASYSVNAITNLTNIELNDELMIIGTGAFYSSKKLTSLAIPKNVINIGGAAISSCTALSDIEISSENKSFWSDGVLVYDGDTVVLSAAFHKNVVIQDGTKHIADGAFLSNTTLLSIVIPDSVTTIGVNAFKGCSKLKSISIGEGLEELDSAAFAELSSLESISVNPANPNFQVIDNVLYSKDGKKLLLAAAKNGMTTLDILDTVTEIGDWAFSYHATLGEVILPNGIRKIGDYAFYECKKIAKFYGSSTLETIGEYAFAFKTPSTAKTDADKTQLCDTLKIVLLYDNMKSIGRYAFYGNFGIVYAYFKMTLKQVNFLISNSGINITYLTHGCYDYDNGGGYVNNNGRGVIRCLYSENEPTIDFEGYLWFDFDEDGEPIIWKKSMER